MNNQLSNFFSIANNGDFKQLKRQLISYFYPFTKEDIIDFKEYINFDYTIFNENPCIQWNIDIIREVKDEIDWTHLFLMKNLKVNLDFIKEFESYIDFHTLQYSKGLIWSQALINSYGDQLNWSSVGVPNKSAIATVQNLKKYENIIDWNKLSKAFDFSSNPHAFKAFINKWNFDKLSSNPTLPFTEKLLNENFEKWNFKTLSRNPQCLYFILDNPEMDCWSWHNVASNSGLTYNERILKLIYQYRKKEVRKKHPQVSKDFPAHILTLLFISIFSNFRLNYAYLFQEQFFSYIPWDIYSRNCKYKLTLDQIDFLKDKLDFSQSKFVQLHQDVLTKGFVKRNIEMMNLNSTAIIYLPVDQNIIENYSKKLSWVFLSSNEQFDWTKEFIQAHLDKLHLNRLSKNQKIFELFFSMTPEKVST